jgi:hypothetical protein
MANERMAMGKPFPVSGGPSRLAMSTPAVKVPELDRSRFAL